jgi:hypothetical protein
LRPGFGGAARETFVRTIRTAGGEADLAIVTVSSRVDDAVERPLEHAGADARTGWWSGSGSCSTRWRSGGSCSTSRRVEPTLARRRGERDRRREHLRAAHAEFDRATAS